MSTHLLLTLTVYGINIPRKSISWSTPKLGGTIIVKRISIYTDSQNDWRTRRDSKEQSRGQNITSLMEKLMKLLTKNAVHGSL